MVTRASNSMTGCAPCGETGLPDWKSRYCCVASQRYWWHIVWGVSWLRHGPRVRATATWLKRLSWSRQEMRNEKSCARRLPHGHPFPWSNCLSRRFWSGVRMIRFAPNCGHASWPMHGDPITSIMVTRVTSMRSLTWVIGLRGANC